MKYIDFVSAEYERNERIKFLSKIFEVYWPARRYTDLKWVTPGKVYKNFGGIFSNNFPNEGAVKNYLEELVNDGLLERHPLFGDLYTITNKAAEAVKLYTESK